jgi:hypothetical protein
MHKVRLVIVPIDSIEPGAGHYTGARVVVVTGVFTCSAQQATNCHSSSQRASTQVCMHGRMYACIMHACRALQCMARPTSDRASST